jgi:gamma-glutamyltranspeptidase / glutathione hydrolase
LTVVEPTGNGIGADAFAIVAVGGELHGLNASGRSPRAWTPERFEGRDAMPLRGWETVTVPGAVSAWVELSRRFGRLPFATLFEPAVHYAAEGFPVSPLIARGWRVAESTFVEYPDFGAAFLPNGRAPCPGETWRFPEQAATLQTIADTGGEAFYRGALAERIVADARTHGAALDEADLDAHRVDWVGTVATPFHGAELHEIPPNGQGLAALIALGILRHLPLAETALDSADFVHLQIEAMKLAFADAHRYVADPEHLDVPVEALLDDDYLARRARLVDPRRAGDPGHGTPARGGTVYLAAGDAEGTMVSFIQSNYYGFGSGAVVPGTGISLQNRGAGFVLTEGHPNRVGGGKRPFHTIIPGFVTQAGAPLAAMGVMGGPMQPQGHMQMLVRMGLFGQNPQAASDAPRWQVVGGLGVSIEASWPAPVLDELRSRGHELVTVAPQESFAFGGAQVVMRLEDGEGYVAASEPRKDGQAVGF